METVVINGNEYTKDEVVEMVSEFASKIVEVWNSLKDIIVNAIANIAEQLESYANYLTYQPGYRRIVKMDELKRYEEMSAGKSNNWRKIHGLHLIRRNSV